MEIPAIYSVLEATPRENLFSVAADASVGRAVHGEPPEDMSKEQQAGEQELKEEFLKLVETAGITTGDGLAFWESVSADNAFDQRWRDLLRSFAESLPPHRIAIWLADLSLDCKLVSDLVSGPGARRMNAILDLFDVPFCASDVQDYYSTVATNLASAKVNRVQTAAGVSAAGVGGFTGGFLFMPFIGTATQRGVDFFFDEISKTDDCSLAVSSLLSCAVAADCYPKEQAMWRSSETRSRSLRFTQTRGSPASGPFGERLHGGHSALRQAAEDSQCGIGCYRGYS